LKILYLYGHDNVTKVIWVTYLWRFKNISISRKYFRNFSWRYFYEM